jgi:methylmalonyl-CoA/ethylmalonyl-CoA epimerase
MVNLKDYKKLKFHHFGYVVKRIDNNVINSFFPVIENKKPLLKFSDYEQKVKVAFFKTRLKGYIELVEPMNKYSPVSNFLKKNRLGGMHHICFETNNLIKSILFLKKNKFLKITPIKVGFEEREIVFMMPESKANFLLELISTSKRKTSLPIKK